MTTIADAHRNYALGVVMARLGRELAILYEVSTSPHDQAILAAEGHVEALELIEAPPVDLQDYIDSHMQAVQDAAQARRDAWFAVKSEVAQAEYLHPLEWLQAQGSPGLADTNYEQAEFWLAAIDEVWTAPGGGD